EGSPEIVDVARRLSRPGSAVQLIVLCGRHETARREVAAMPRAVRMFVDGFTARAPYYTELADFFIGKPGPGSISEAALKRLPVIVRFDWATLAHERYNCEWVREQEIGVVIRSLEGLCGAVAEVLERRERFGERLSRLRNRAVFEIPSILGQI